MKLRDIRLHHAVNVKVGANRGPHSSLTTDKDAKDRRVDEIIYDPTSSIVSVMSGDECIVFPWSNVAWASPLNWSAGASRKGS
jgi:hypothetical protein